MNNYMAKSLKPLRENDIRGVPVVHWNPVRVLPPPSGIVRRRKPRRVNNFGDLLGPLIVQTLAPLGTAPSHRRLLAVGSIIHLARDGDVVWGSGVNGKVPDEQYAFERLDIRALRGPKSRQWLLDRGLDAPEVYGDPALLLPELFPVLGKWAATKRHPVTVIPNLNDWASAVRGPHHWHPRNPLSRTLKRIAQSDFVIGSSLHAIIVAEALKIPARAVASPTEPSFKYEDYYEGTGRQVELASSMEEALSLGGAAPITTWDPGPLIQAFPRDLWLSDVTRD